MSSINHHRDDVGLCANTQAVCVSALMIQEIKRIIKESEIMKCVNLESPKQLGHAN